ncbi:MULTISPECIES: YqzH family protein [Bacillus]|uniref:YqzH family protein n=1 Tax=Bacillus TaxID=1386 RepID=UPI000BB85646|nr:MULTISPECIES: YqzH family protein [Bacillus]
MDIKLIEKMIRNAFIQYEHTPLTEQQYIELAVQVQKTIQSDGTSDLFEVVQDVVYEYLSKWD